MSSPNTPGWMKDLAPWALRLGAPGLALVIIGWLVYRSDPYYNDTSDPVGEAMIVIGIGLFVGAWFVQKQWRGARRADLLAEETARARARDSATAQSSTDGRAASEER